MQIFFILWKLLFGLQFFFWRIATCWWIYVFI